MPDPVSIIDYNRFLYAKGNPFKYRDPSGNIPVIIVVIAVALLVSGSVASEPAGPYSGGADNANGELAIGLLAGDVNDFVTLAAGHDYIWGEDIPYGSAEWYITMGFAALPLASGSLTRAFRKTGEPIREVVEMSAKEIAWTQNTIAPYIRNPKMQILDLARSMAAEGWNGPPLHVVDYQGGFFSLDNRRLAAAKMAGTLLPEGEDMVVPVTKLEMDDVFRKGNQGGSVSVANEFNRKSTGIDSGTANVHVIVRNTRGSGGGTARVLMDGTHNIFMR